MYGKEKKFEEKSTGIVMENLYPNPLFPDKPYKLYKYA